MPNAYAEKKLIIQAEIFRSGTTIDGRVVDGTLVDELWKNTKLFVLGQDVYVPVTREHFDSNPIPVGRITRVWKKWHLTHKSLWAEIELYDEYAQRYEEGRIPGFSIDLEDYGYDKNGARFGSHISGLAVTAKPAFPWMVSSTSYPIESGQFGRKLDLRIFKDKVFTFSINHRQKEVDIDNMTMQEMKAVILEVVQPLIGQSSQSFKANNIDAISSELQKALGFINSKKQTFAAANPAMINPKLQQLAKMVQALMTTLMEAVSYDPGIQPEPEPEMNPMDMGMEEDYAGFPPRKQPGQSPAAQPGFKPPMDAPPQDGEDPNQKKKGAFMTDEYARSKAAVDAYAKAVQEQFKLPLPKYEDVIKKPDPIVNGERPTKAQLTDMFSRLREAGKFSAEGTTSYAEEVEKLTKLACDMGCEAAEFAWETSRQPQTPLNYNEPNSPVKGDNFTRVEGENLAYQVHLYKRAGRTTEEIAKSMNLDEKKVVQLFNRAS